MNIFLLQVALASKKQQEEAFNILRLLVGPTRAQPGCLACCIFQQEPTHKKFRAGLIEKWETRKDLERHIRSEDFRMALAVIDMASELPDIEFHTVTQSQGMELIQALRGGGDAVL